MLSIRVSITTRAEFDSATVSFCHNIRSSVRNTFLTDSKGGWLTHDKSNESHQYSITNRYGCYFATSLDKQNYASYFTQVLSLNMQSSENILPFFFSSFDTLEQNFGHMQAECSFVQRTRRIKFAIKKRRTKKGLPNGKRNTCSKEKYWRLFLSMWA